ncbi:midline-1-like protein [Aphelenchoides avenae]|nr:midline-1-like protein [Aphelenchus avenae]
MVPTSPSCTESLACTVCLEMYRDPLTLPSCGHSVCSACVLQLIANTASPGNVVCPECRVHSSVTPNGFTRSYRLAGIIATLEAAGYRETSQCSGCRSQVPNRRLRECVTCAKELRCREILALEQSRRIRPQSMKGLRYRKMTKESANEAELTVKPSLSVVIVVAMCETSLPITAGARFKAVILAVIKFIFIFLCIALTVFFVGIFFDSVGPIEALSVCMLVVAFGLAIYGIGAWCHRVYQKEF